MKLKYIGWAQFLLKNGKTVCIDPFYSCEKADIVLVTHGHPDHLKAESLAKVKKDSSVVITNKETSQYIPGSEVIAVNEEKEKNHFKKSKRYSSYSKSY